MRRDIGMKQKDLSLLSGSNHHKRDRVREGNTPYRRTLWRLGDALDAFGCEDATETLCGDWHPLRGKKVNIC